VGKQEFKEKDPLSVMDVMTIPKYMAGLGFMDMELFNLSLLAKQTWSHESLSTCIFHVVYFQERRGSVPYHLKHGVFCLKGVIY
jgi:hypothetical protein